MHDYSKEMRISRGLVDFHKLAQNGDTTRQEHDIYKGGEMKFSTWIQKRWIMKIQK